MRRRRMIGCGLSAAALLPFGAQRAMAYVPGTTVLRVAVSNPRGSQTSEGAFAFARSVNERSQGRVRVEVYVAAEAGGELEVMQDMAAGAFEMSLTSSAGYAAPGIAPGLGVFDIPFLFRNVAHARGLLDSPVGTAALSQLSDAGLVGLSWCENGLRHVTTASQAVRSPRDLAGLTIRVPQSEVMVKGFTALGATAKPLAFTELYGALASGQFQAQENPVSNTKASGFDRVQKFLCLTGHVYSAAILVMTKSAYDQLSAEDRAIVGLAAAAAAKASRSAGDMNDKADIETLRSRGMTIVDDVDRPAFIAASAPVRAEFERTFGKAWMDSIRTFGA